MRFLSSWGVELRVGLEEIFSEVGVLDHAYRCMLDVEMGICASRVVGLVVLDRKIRLRMPLLR